MRNTVLILLISAFQVFATGSYAQTKKISLAMNDAAIRDVLYAIQKQSEFYFLYNSELIDVTKKVDITIEEEKVDQVLTRLFNKNEVDFLIKDHYIILTPVGGNAELFAEQQQPTVSGKVTDDTDQPLPGVTIVIKGTTRGTVTNVDGEYNLTNLPEDATLVFSFVGMRTQEVVVGNQTRINLEMVVDAIGIEEVVAVGYGSLQRNRISTSIASVSPEKIENQLNKSIDRSLEGQVAGLTIKQTSGAPGGGSVMRIRGVSSIGGSNSPLFVVDGVPMHETYGKDQSPLSIIDQADIESIDILKDVSATAIYGSRGSNGVVIITTRSGMQGKTEVRFSANTGLEKMHSSAKMPVMNAEEFARWRKEDAYEYANYYGEEISIDDIPVEYQDPEYWIGKGTDWQDVMTRVSPHHSYNLNITHGTEDFTGYFSIGYTHNDGVIKETSFKRLALRSNIDYKLNNFVKVGLNISPTIRWWGNSATTSYNRVANDSRSTPWGTAITIPPTDGPYLDDYPNEQPEFFDGKWDTNIHSSGTFNFDNPLYKLKYMDNNDTQFDMIIQPYIEFALLKGLTFKSQLNMQMSNSYNNYFKPSGLNHRGNSWGSTPPIPTAGAYTTGKTINWQFENFLNYQNSFGKHNLGGLLGNTMEHYNHYSSILEGFDYPGDRIKTLNAATEFGGNSYESNWSLLSTMLRVNYDYDVKYLLAATIRRDGSSRFGSERRWGYFPSLSLGWNISKENFFPELSWLTNLKLRTSYGFSGNNDIGNYTWIPTLNTHNYPFGGSLTSGKYVNGIRNTKLGWEKSQEANIGVDLSLVNNRLNFVFDAYRKTTKDMLWSVRIPSSSGFNSMSENIGEVRNEGLEFLVNSINIDRNDFNWETDFNISFNRNKVISLGYMNEIILGGSHASSGLITRVGHPIGMFYGYEMLGVFQNKAETEEFATIVGGQEAGTIRFKDTNEDGVINNDDKVLMGSPHPAFRGGMNNRFKYKNWDFNISMSFAHDFDIYASMESTSLNLDGVFNVFKEVEERWRSPEQPGNGRIPATFHQTHLFRDWSHSGCLYNVSFLKIQNLSLGYTLRDLSFAKQLRLSFSVQNPALFTNYKYGNPDGDVHGDSTKPNYDEYDYPLTRIFDFGVNVVF